jgi:hypothetical protein
MLISDTTMEMLIAQRLEDIATRCEYHQANNDFDLVELLRKSGYALAEAFDEENTILVAEALF